MGMVLQTSTFAILFVVFWYLVIGITDAKWNWLDKVIRWLDK
jgi:hypothetical protein